MDPKYSQDELDNHSNQMNPNNDAYWQSRGYNDRPSYWDESDDSGYDDYDDDDYGDGFSDDDADAWPWFSED